MRRIEEVIVSGRVGDVRGRSGIPFTWGVALVGAVDGEGEGEGEGGVDGVSDVDIVLVRKKATGDG